MIVARCFEFQAAHHLPRHPGKCRRLHGHTYRLEVLCQGRVDPESGMVVDFADLKATVREKILDRVDHQNLNDLLENPTAEIIAAWVWRELRQAGLPVHEIRLWETSACYVAYRGEEEADE